MKNSEIILGAALLGGACSNEDPNWEERVKENTFSISGTAGTTETIPQPKMRISALPLDTGLIVPNASSGVSNACYQVESSEPGTIYDLSLTDISASIGGAVEKVYLFSEDGIRLSPGETPDENGKVEFIDFNFEVDPANDEKENQFCAVVDVRTVQNNLAGATSFQLSITELEDVTASEDLLDNFPQDGRFQDVVASSVGSVAISPILTDLERTVSAFHLEMSDEDAEFESIRLKKDSDLVALSAIELFHNGEYLPITSIDETGWVMLRLDTPILIQEGESSSFFIQADVSGLAAGSTFRMFLEEPVDLDLIGLTFGAKVDVADEQYNGDQAADFTETVVY